MRNVSGCTPLLAALTIASLFLLAAPLRAGAVSPAVLAPGGTVSSIPDFEDFGTVLNSINTAFGNGSSPSGPFQEVVETDTGFNPFGNQFLVFAFLFRVTNGDVVQISLPGYSGLSTAVKECTTCTGGTPAFDVTRSADGDVISFNFSGNGIVANGNETASMAIYTNASAYVDPPMISFTDIGGRVALAPGFAPAAVPEPGSFGLLGMAVFVLAAWCATRRPCRVR